MVVLFGLGLYMVGLSYYDPWYNRAPSLHISLGLLVLLLTLIRIVWRLAQRRNPAPLPEHRDRKSTRLNSSHVAISYAVFCLKKKKKQRVKLSESITAAESR